jgi:hypothetical protein
LVSAFGCHKGPAKVQVTGTVKFSDGSPLNTGTVFFEGKNYSARGAIGADGSFTMGTVDADDGVVPGKYGVAIIANEAISQTGVSDEDFYETKLTEPKPLVAAKFANAATSGLTCDVTAGGTKADFTVERP